jgi:hypothetical protein
MSVASVFKSIGRGVKAAVKHIAAGFVALFGHDAASKFVKDSYVLLQSAVGKIVSQVVKDLSESSLDGAAKREAAVEQVLQLARQQAIEVAESEIRLLIELAVQFAKGNFQVQVSS